jgi:hypothetical protein
MTGDSSTSYTTVRPSDSMTRQELCALIARFANVVEPGITSSKGSVDYSNIQGMGDVADWARDSVEWCASEGIVGGVNSGGTFYMNPTDTAWRASMAKMITVVLRDVIG